ncbi:MAG TPA: dihydropteroate synthase [Burkholderiaceae bacterium]|nr:dihydropteroate synthase [Burkholderiaceae bacterium]
MSTSLQCGRFELDLGRPLVMGILNVTPDSFSDGTGELSINRVLERAHRMVEDGADLLDIGGESTRPGAHPVPLQEELDRVLPLLEALHDLQIPLSVDTFKPEVMKAALHAGADMINDIRALREPGALEVVRNSQCGLCIMHMQGEPRTMQANPHYDDVVADVRTFLAQRVSDLLQAGIARERVVLDPGFGFGKTVGQNYLMLRRLDQMRVDDYPWLLGFSRKSMLGHIVGREPRDRLAASLAAALYGLEMGGHILRVHDVAETVDAVKIWQTIKDESFV